jgi:Domain of unknown function (DUF4062)
LNVKYQIFVSSTFEDLRDERNEIIKACLSMGHIPVGMEMFNAADEEQWAVIQRTIDQCDYYVVIVAHRYGSTTPEGISFTEKEYDYAVSQGVPVLGFPIDNGARWPSNRIDKDQASVEALTRFKAKVKQKMVRFWSDRSELQAHFAVSLTQSVSLYPRRGWVRAPEAADADVAQSISALAQSVSDLQRLAANPPGTTPEAEFSAKSLLKYLSTRKWLIKGRETTGLEVFIGICEALGGGSATGDSIARQLEANADHLTRFLHSLELLGALSRRNYYFSVSDIGEQMYRILIVSSIKRPD